MSNSLQYTLKKRPAEQLTSNRYYNLISNFVIWIHNSKTSPVKWNKNYGEYEIFHDSQQNDFHPAPSICKLAIFAYTVRTSRLPLIIPLRIEFPGRKLPMKSTDLFRKAWKAFLESDVCCVADCIQTITSITFHTGSTRTICKPAILRAIKKMPIHGSSRGTFSILPQETTFHFGSSLFENVIR